MCSALARLVAAAQEVQALEEELANDEFMEGILAEWGDEDGFHHRA
jgi:hypothetical protein